MTHVGRHSKKINSIELKRKLFAFISQQLEPH